MDDQVPIVSTGSKSDSFLVPQRRREAIVPGAMVRCVQDVLRSGGGTDRSGAEPRSGLSPQIDVVLLGAGVYASASYTRGGTVTVPVTWFRAAIWRAP